MRKLSDVLSLAALVFGATILPMVAQIDERSSTEQSTIALGVAMDQAIGVLERHGCDRPYGLSWTKPGPDKSFQAFQIDEGVVLALAYLDKDKSIASLQWIVTSLELSKGQERVLEVRQVHFEPDGSYVVHLEKQARQQPVNPALPASPLTKLPKTKSIR